MDFVRCHSREYAHLTFSTLNLFKHEFFFCLSWPKPFSHFCIFYFLQLFSFVYRSDFWFRIFWVLCWFDNFVWKNIYIFRLCNASFGEPITICYAFVCMKFESKFYCIYFYTMCCCTFLSNSFHCSIKYCNCHLFLVAFSL